MGVIVASDIWKEIGWGAIIYLAALTSISPELYEAASIDGASRLQQILHHLLARDYARSFCCMFILRMGYILDAGFDQIYILYNPLVYQSTDIIDTWVFRNGIEEFRFHFPPPPAFSSRCLGWGCCCGATNWHGNSSGQGIW